MPPSGVQSSTIHVGDLAVPCEYKKSRKDIRENRKQLLGTTTFCMNDDPCRKHIYGITIENDTMAVWYFSRSHSAKSPDFKFTEDCRTYIRVMLSLMFANEAELGYDPTIQRRLDPEVDKICLVYKVEDHYYKTKSAIFDHRSLCITGRATRVWDAIKVKSFNELQPLEGSDPVILKDVWLDVGSMTEGDIQRAMFGDLEQLADALGKGVEPNGFTGMDDESKETLRECLLAQDWQQYFLTLVDEWQGTVSKEVAEVAKPDVKLFDPRRATVADTSGPKIDKSRITLSEPSNVHQPTDKPFNRRHCPKRQSRVVFKEVCVALHDVPKLDDAMTAMLSCVIALQLMFLAGWVHRDISSGNLYWFKNNKGEVRGILGDLEYAKRFCPSGATGSADPKTGTAFFMAVEIQLQVHLYMSESSQEDSSDDSAEDASESTHERHLVVHNFEHDMESIFWLLLWTLLVRFPCNRDSETKSKFSATVYEIFQDTSTCSPTRLGVFTQQGTLFQILQNFLAPQVKSLRYPLDRLRRTLARGYLARKHNFDDLSSYSKLYRRLLSTLNRCRNWAEDDSFPDLDQSRSLYVDSPDTEATIRRRPLQVKKRERPQASAGDDDEYRPGSSKTARVEGGTDVSSLRAEGSAAVSSSQAGGSADSFSSRNLREKNLGVSYVERDDESDES